MPTDFIIDSSAVLALINNEAGAGFVATRLSKSVISAVNDCEVRGKLYQDAPNPDIPLSFYSEIGLEVLPFDALLAEIAAQLITETKKHGLSLGDRACLATAIAHKKNVITADRVWKKLSLPVKIEIIR